MNTLIARLEEKGLVERENRIVKAELTKEQFNHLQMKENIEYMYEGKLSRFLAVYVGQEGINKEETGEIIKILEQSKE